MSFGSWGEYEHFIETMVRSNTIQDSSKIWWDLRPNHTYPTLEFRVCDMCTRVEEVVCIAAIFQAIVLKLWKLRRDNLTFRLYPEVLMAENKWRAARYGLTGKLIDFGKQTEHPARDLIAEIIEWFLDDVVDELGSRSEVEYALTLLKGGSSSARQLAVYEETDDPEGRRHASDLGDGRRSLTPRHLACSSRRPEMPVRVSGGTRGDVAQRPFQPTR